MGHDVTLTVCGGYETSAGAERDNPDRALMTVAMLPRSFSASPAKQEREDETREEETRPELKAEDAKRAGQAVIQVQSASMRLAQTLLRPQRERNARKQASRRVEMRPAQQIATQYTPRCCLSEHFNQACSDGGSLSYLSIYHYSPFLSSEITETKFSFKSIKSSEVH
ncbi:hypothetical protein IRJ41_009723 [Triplophysa rosa]|uniref:Uncharacterized protein n=1 Tax=Triplophysa rosa TaxID=992332 RepID=A0A9W7TJ15_TRIRA|nr:hypothetical protein IRJ41_009723 [Triplophysa rosa]